MVHGVNLPLVFCSWDTNILVFHKFSAHNTINREEIEEIDEKLGEDKVDPR